MLVPMFAIAKGFVPCGGPGEPTCQMCYWVEQVDLLTKWLVSIFGVIFSIMLVVSGLRLVNSAGNVAAKEAAKSSISNALIGFVIILGGWLFVDFAMKALLNSSFDTSKWNEIACVDQPEPTIIRYTANGDNKISFTQADTADRVTGIVNAGPVNNMTTEAANATGLTPEQEKIFKGLVSQESSNCKNKVGPPTKYGTAYGCTQMLVSTARDVDKKADNRFSGMSDSQVANILKNDDAYSIKLGSVYFKQRLDKYGGNVDYALASYNGGGGAVTDSTVCPGQKAYECLKNSGYSQTRNYVSNIKSIAAKL